MINSYFYWMCHARIVCVIARIIEHGAEKCPRICAGWTSVCDDLGLKTNRRNWVHASTSIITEKGRDVEDHDRRVLRDGLSREWIPVIYSGVGMFRTHAYQSSAGLSCHCGSIAIICVVFVPRTTSVKVDNFMAFHHRESYRYNASQMRRPSPMPNLVVWSRGLDSVWVGWCKGRANPDDMARGGGGATTWIEEKRRMCIAVSPMRPGCTRKGSANSSNITPTRTGRPTSPYALLRRTRAGLRYLFTRRAAHICAIATSIDFSGFSMPVQTSQFAHDQRWVILEMVVPDRRQQACQMHAVSKQGSTLTTNSCHRQAPEDSKHMRIGLGQDHSFIRVCPVIWLVHCI